MEEYIILSIIVSMMNLVATFALGCLVLGERKSTQTTNNIADIPQEKR